ncbi:PREDICTED: carbon catabolite repressor protein 4 homolog 3-like isoform X2 [Camelina sativa]|uniref:Carbon catabolite repressor protein 4 homolog 3-like isoform X2 n=1 Tax=Camelina sativa TaxID=90675 RepID=A0ABM0W5H1_CAMSA|nr:PREDICTED: carbon catabolite repressor protein 4 homolog 3-like isoform X2 [Camelina sativa]
MPCVNCVGCSSTWSRPSSAYNRISFCGHLSSSGFYRCPLSLRSSCDANKYNLAVSCSSTSGPSDSNPEPSSNRKSYSRRWHNPLPRRRHPDQMPSSRIVRDWIDSDSTTPLSQERFTVVSYNILGDRNASHHKDLYTNVSFPYLKWGYRKRLICEELIRLNPDIICLQEVDKYFDLFSMMEKAGYAGSYKRRTGDNIDGCAMFWKADRFRVLERENIEFSQFGMCDNVAQLAVLELRKCKSRKILLGNIHVLYNPNKGDVKLGQIRSLCSKAHLLSKKWGDIPIVLGGDFNSTPQSPLYSFLASSELNIIEHDKKELSGQKKCRPTQVLETGSKSSNTIMFNSSSWTNEEIRVATGQENSYWAVHPLKLNSSYASVKGSANNTRDSVGEPLATSYHSKFLGTVDYLWYSDGLVPARVLDTLPIDVLCKTKCLPCKELGSDHLALVSELRFFYLWFTNGLSVFLQITRIIWYDTKPTSP